MLPEQQNHSLPRPFWFAAAFVLPLFLLYLLFTATARPALGRAPEAGGIIVSPTAGLITTEAGGSITFTVVLTSAPSGPVVITMTSSDTSEGVLASNSLTFLPSNWDQAQTVTVLGVDDVIDDGDVAYTIVTAPADSNDPDYDGLDPADVSLTNTDNDTAGL